jgi:hypothetical protein
MLRLVVLPQKSVISLLQIETHTKGKGLPLQGQPFSCLIEYNIGKLTLQER